MTMLQEPSLLRGPKLGLYQGLARSGFLCRWNLINLEVLLRINYISKRMPLKQWTFLKVVPAINWACCSKTGWLTIKIKIKTSKMRMLTRTKLMSHLPMGTSNRACSNNKKLVKIRIFTCRHQPRPHPRNSDQWGAQLHPTKCCSTK